MDEAEKIVETVEKISEKPVDHTTIIAAIIVFVVLLWMFYVKIWPVIKKKYDDSVQKKVEENNEHKKLEEVTKKQEEHDKQFQEMIGTIRKVSKSVDNISDQLTDVLGENKLTLSVLLDIVECMQNKTSPEECAKKAQGSINKYYREGKVPPTIIN